MACVFCGSDKRSREHVISRRWDGPLRSSQTTAPGATPAPITNRWTPPPGSDLVGRQWNSAKPDLVTTDVCKRCNNEWLNSIDDDAEPLLIQMFVGRPVTLGSEEQKTLALWAYKTVLLMQLVRPAEVRPALDERYRELHGTRRPPADVRISLGATQGASAVHEATTEANLTTGPSTTPGFLSFIATGNLLTVMAGRLSDKREPLHFDAAPDRDVLVPIWPASLRAIRWSPPTVIEDLQPTSIAALLGASARPSVR